MLENIFKGIFDAEWMTVIGVEEFLLCMCFALILGFIISKCYMYKSFYSQSYAITLALLPCVVCVVIMLVNGNIGAGVAVAGAFSLVRYRSNSGSAREICMIFFAMGAGLICGMGYIGYAALFTILICFMFIVYNKIDFGIQKRSDLYKTIRITIPENLDYSDVFDDIFLQYLTSCELVNVKTTNMGSMYKLTYDVVLKDNAREKEMIDELRCRNGNLEINVSKTALSNSEML